MWNYKLYEYYIYFKKLKNVGVVHGSVAGTFTDVNIKLFYTKLMKSFRNETNYNLNQLNLKDVTRFMR